VTSAKDTSTLILLRLVTSDQEGNGKDKLLEPINQEGRLDPTSQKEKQIEEGTQIEEETTTMSSSPRATGKTEEEIHQKGTTKTIEGKSQTDVATVAGATINRTSVEIFFTK
jgi:hypothetical protein